MEEVSTTAVLETEILESARKKVIKIGKDGETKRQAFERDFMKAVGDEEAVIERKLLEKIAKVNHELKARFPLEKKRISLDHAQKKLDSELADFFRSLGADELFGFLKAGLESVSALFSGPDCTFSCAGISEAETRRGIGFVNPDAVSWKFKPIPGSSDSELPLIVIENSDCTLTYRTGVRALMKNLESNQRGVLLHSLFGESLKP